LDTAVNAEDVKGLYQKVDNDEKGDVEEKFSIQILMIFV
jgi:hypothetical protein